VVGDGLTVTDRGSVEVSLLYGQWARRQPSAVRSKRLSAVGVIRNLLLALIGYRSGAAGRADRHLV